MVLARCKFGAFPRNSSVMLSRILYTCGRWRNQSCEWHTRLNVRSIITDIHHQNPHGPPAFVFDIDGVLIRGKHVLPAALEAMKKLCPQGNWKYPVVFMTNGGGVTEAVKAQQLSKKLEVPISERQVLLSHTPMRDLVPRLADVPVLLAGRHNVTEVAHHYGFNKVLTTTDLAARHPEAVPFIRRTECQQGSHEHAQKDKAAAPPAPAAGVAASQPGTRKSDLSRMGTNDDPIRAVLVMSDPSNWYLDAQLMIDVLATAGVPTRRHPAPGAAPVELYFSNPDLLWANNFPRNRFGQGAFAHLVLSLYKEMTGRNQLDFPVKFFGKPNPEPYSLAQRMLTAQAVDLGLISKDFLKQQDTSADSARHQNHNHRNHTGAGNQQQHHKQHRTGQASGSLATPFSGIYAVGDNPAADVRGANSAGHPWVSVLVQTGVFQGPGHNCNRDTAAIAVRDVLAAVDAALHRTRSLRFHSMR